MLIHCGSPWRRLCPHAYMHIWLSMITCWRSPHPCSLLYLTFFLQWLSFPWLLTFKPVLSLIRSPTQSSPMGFVYFLTKGRNPGLAWIESLEVWSNSWGCCVTIQNCVSFDSLLTTEPLQSREEGMEMGRHHSGAHPHWTPCKFVQNSKSTARRTHQIAPEMEHPTPRA